MNQLMIIYGGIYRAALALPGLLNTDTLNKTDTEDIKYTLR